MPDQLQRPQHVSRRTLLALLDGRFQELGFDASQSELASELEEIYNHAITVVTLVNVLIEGSMDEEDDLAQAVSDLTAYLAHLAEHAARVKGSLEDFAEHLALE